MMHISFSEDNSKVIVTERVKELNPGYIFGIDPENPDYVKEIQRASPSGGRWISRTIPSLLNILLQKKWHIEVVCKSPSILIDHSNANRTEYASTIRLRNGSELVRWHGDVLILKREDIRCIINAKEIVSVTARKWSGLKETKEFSPTCLVVTPDIEDSKYIDLRVETTHTDHLEGLVEGYASGHQKTRERFSLTHPCGNRPMFMGSYHCKNMQDLEFALIHEGFQVSDAEYSLNETIRELKTGNSLFIRLSTSNDSHYLTWERVKDVQQDLSRIGD